MRVNAARLESVGWYYRAGMRPGLRVDEWGDRSFRLARVRQSSGVTRRITESHVRPPAVIAMLQTEGRAHVVVPGVHSGEVVLDAGSFLVVNDDDALEYSSDAPATRLEAHFAVPATPFLAPAASGRSEDALFARVLWAMIELPLDGSPPESSRDAIHLRLAMWEIVAGLRGTSRRRPSGVTAREHELFQAAIRVIRDRAHDPEFGAGDISEALHVSDRYLRTIYAKHGDTPRGMLARGRLTQALMALRSTTVARPLHDDGFARGIGFSSSRQLRGALSRMNEADAVARPARPPEPIVEWRPVRPRVAAADDCPG